MEAPAPEPEEPVYVRELLPGVTAKGLGLCVQRVPSSEMACAGTDVCLGGQAAGRVCALTIVLGGRRPRPALTTGVPLQGHTSGSSCSSAAPTCRWC